MKRRNFIALMSSAPLMSSGFGGWDKWEFMGCVCWIRDVKFYDIPLSDADYKRNIDYLGELACNGGTL